MHSHTLRSGLTKSILLASAWALPLPSAAADTCGWVLRSPVMPGRNKCNMVFDSGRNVTVLHGGRTDAADSVGETWEWNGTTWVFRTTLGPGGRWDAALAYDSIRARVVLFGGYLGSALGDTWEWNGTTWTLKATSGPPAKSNASIAFDSARGVTVMLNNGTWEWSGSVWTLRSATNPGGRLVYDSANGVCIALSNGTWAWDGSTWTQLSTTHYAGPAAYDPIRGLVLVYSTTNIAQWDGSSWTIVTPGGPTPQCLSPAIAFDASRGVLEIYGGDDGANLRFGQTWEWDGVNWSLRDGGPPPLYDHRMVYDTVRHETLLFCKLTVNTYAWDGSSWSARSMAGPTSPKSAAFDTARGVAVLHDGTRTWEWNGTLWSQVATTGPTGDSMMAYDSARQVSVLVKESQTWEWNGSTWQQRIISTPQIPRFMAFDSRRNVCVLYSQFTPGDGVETWEYDGVAWTRRSAPPEYNDLRRYASAMAYDAGRGVCVMYGGIRYGSPPLGLADDTQQWDGSTWTQAAIVSAGVRSNHAMAYDSDRGVVVLVGGKVPTTFNGATYDAKTWELRVEPEILQHPAAQAATFGNVVNFHVSASGQGTLTYQWRRNGSDLADGGRISGATTATLAISSVQPTDAGDYDVVVGNSCGSTTSLPAALTVCVPCDTNCDGSVNPFDINAFLQLLNAGPQGQCSPCAGDTDGDGTTNPFDINGFVDCMTV